MRLLAWRDPFASKLGIAATEAALDLSQTDFFTMKVSLFNNVVCPPPAEMSPHTRRMTLAVIPLPSRAFNKASMGIADGGVRGEKEARCVAVFRHTKVVHRGFYMTKGERYE